MEQDEFTLEYFCRLCATEGVLGVMLHPLFPPGDDDPKDELVRMIDVLTSVTLTRTQDSGAVICDKCLQMLDLFCQFREECLRQDVMIRTRRELDKERRMEEAAAAAAATAVCVEIKEEPEQEPPTIVIDDCKDEPPEEDEDDDDDEEVEEQPCANQVAQQLLASSLVANSSSSNSSSSFMTPAEISLYSQTSSLSISVQVNQISLDNMAAAAAAMVAVPAVQTMPEVHAPPTQAPPSSSTTTSSGSTTFRKGKLDPNKPPPDCELCQESFSTHYDYEQHLDQVHAWDRGTRCSLACDPCQMRFTKSYNLKRHMYEVHGELAPGLTVTACEYCGLKFLRGYTLNRHVAKMHSKRAKAKKMMIIKSK